MRRTVEFFVGLAMFVIALVLTVLEAAHYSEMIERAIPEWMAPMITAKFNLIVILVGLILMALAWLERKSERRRYAHSSLERDDIQPIAATHPALPKPEPFRGTKSEGLGHNIQFVGFKLIQIDPGLPDLALAALCFENILIPGKSLGNFRLAELRVVYRDFTTGEVIATAYPAKWHDSPDAPIDICADEKRCAIIASSLGSKWATDSLIEVTINPELQYGPGGTEYKRESVPLQLGRIKVKATLIGAHNLSIPPVEGILTLGEDGNASFVENKCLTNLFSRCKTR